jgi:DNA-binding MarR family transcriptional regulator
VTVATQWLSSAELAAWVRLVAVVELLPTALDSQLRRDAGLLSFDYYVLAMLSEAPGKVLRMSALAAQTNSTPARLSNVVKRLEGRGLIARRSPPGDGRGTEARLTTRGLATLRAAAPGHVATVREHVIDALTHRQITELTAITDAILQRLDPAGRMQEMYHRHDSDS